MQKFPSHVYQHKNDLESFINLKSINWISALSKKIVGEELEQDFYLLNLMDNVLMTEKDFPQIHKYVDRACEILNISNKPNLFLDTCSEPKTMCIGEKKPMLIISTTIIELLSKEELEAALAHELGHLACGHSFYKILVENFSGITQSISAVPGLTALSVAAKIPLYNWFRNADLSADRAALLVIKKPEVILSIIGKLAGGSTRLAECVSEESLLTQSEEIEQLTEEMKSGGTMDKITYLFSTAVMNGIMRQNPWPAVRMKEIRDWSQSDDYQKIVQGVLREREPEKQDLDEVEEGGTFNKISSKVMFWKD